MDKVYGVANPYCDYRLFTQTSKAYVKSHRLNPKASVSTRTIEDLALKHLKMKNICNLALEDHKIMPLMRLHAEIKVHGHETKAERQRMFKREFEKQQEGFIKDLKNRFDNAVGLTRVMHFICHVQSRGSGHAILVSVVQNSTGRALYIFDNMNQKIGEYSDIMKYIRYLGEYFEVSSASNFKGPHLPTRWPSLPARKRYKYYY